MTRKVALLAQALLQDVHGRQLYFHLMLFHRLYLIQFDKRDKLMRQNARCGMTKCFASRPSRNHSNTIQPGHLMPFWGDPCQHASSAAFANLNPIQMLQAFGMSSLNVALGIFNTEVQGVESWRHNKLRRSSRLRHMGV